MSTIVRPNLDGMIVLQTITLCPSLDVVAASRFRFGGLDVVFLREKERQNQQTQRMPHLTLCPMNGRKENKTLERQIEQLLHPLFENKIMQTMV